MENLRATEAFKEFASEMAEVATRKAAENIPAEVSFPFDFKLTSIDSKPLNLEDHQGKVVIVDFWGTWCPPLGACYLAAGARRVAGGGWRTASTRFREGRLPANNHQLGISRPGPKQLGRPWHVVLLNCHLTRARPAETAHATLARCPPQNCHMTWACPR